jgi:hypothetical protein
MRRNADPAYLMHNPDGFLRWESLLQAHSLALTQSVKQQVALAGPILDARQQREPGLARPIRQRGKVLLRPLVLVFRDRESVQACPNSPVDQLLRIYTAAWGVQSRVNVKIDS